jgi:hypothetical protein
MKSGAIRTAVTSSLLILTGYMLTGTRTRSAIRARWHRNAMREVLAEFESMHRRPVSKSRQEPGSQIQNTMSRGLTPVAQRLQCITPDDVKLEIADDAIVIDGERKVKHVFLRMLEANPVSVTTPSFIAMLPFMRSPFFWNIVQAESCSSSARY